MFFKEKLLWIIDTKQRDDYQTSIDFVHSLGKKCDCVGWSVLNMDEPDADHILDEINNFCKKNGCGARGWYERSYYDITSDWFELKTSLVKDGTICDFIDVQDEDGNEICLDVIRAYHELSRSPKEWHGIYVSERFRNTCINNHIEGVDFCWITDKGKYDSEQWFNIYPHNQISQIACNRGVSHNISKINALGGALPKIASIFYDLSHIRLPDCYLLEDMPSGGFAYVLCPETDSFSGRRTILIHKDTAEMLISAKALSQTDLIPACVLDTWPEGYTICKTQKLPKPTREYIQQSIIFYENIKKTNRPVRRISEKDALKVFRAAKRERKDDFEKRISKAVTETIFETEYQLLLPYYQVANGGYLSDEYELLTYQKSMAYTKEFFAELEKEELLETKPIGKVFAICADGDAVLVTEDGKIIRFGHEAPEIINEWQTIAHFFFDAINEN